MPAKNAPSAKRHAEEVGRPVGDTERDREDGESREEFTRCLYGRDAVRGRMGSPLSDRAAWR
jgi:hypothetical protein